MFNGVSPDPAAMASEDEFHCELCGETFGSQQELEEHGSEAHQEGDEEPERP